MDIFDHARNHHRRAVRLVGQVKAAQSEAQCKEAFGDLKHELRDHEHVEAELLYPALRSADASHHQLVSGLLTEHNNLKALCSRVEAAKPYSDDWRRALDDLAASLSQHVNVEESQVFPRARESLDSNELQRLDREAGGSGGKGGSAGRERSGQVAGKAQHKARETAEEAGQWLDEHASQWAGDAQRKVKSLLREQGQSAAGRGHEIASALRDTGENLERKGNSELGRYAVEAAERIDHWMSRLENGEVDQLMDQLRSTARRHPAMLFGGAIAAGFLLSRFLKSSGSGSRGARQWSSADEHEYAAWEQAGKRDYPGGQPHIQY